MKSDATSIDDYLAGLPADRRAALSTVREVILKNLPQGYRETMAWGMISYGIPLDRYPNTYNKQPLALAALASQKNYISLYLMTVYGSREVEKWFKERYQASGKKLDMGKSCVHFRKADDLPLDLVGEVIGRVSVDEYIQQYEKTHLKK
jgi:hypothetical protein